MANRFIITSAVNNTRINTVQFATLVKMSQLLGAQLIVVPTVYKNPDLYRRGLLNEYWWPAEISPYICEKRLLLNRHICLRADASIEHTAVNPLTGANHAGGMMSEIFAHPQIAIEFVPTPKDRVPKGLYTTGTISHKNYGGSWKAKKAEFHHSNSALLVEVSGDSFWPTHLPWDGRGINLYGKYYTPKGVKKAPPLAGIVYGDIHEDCLSKRERACLMRLMRGAGADKNVVCDVLDFHTGSHHKRGDVLTNLRHRDFNIRGELNRAVKFLAGVPNCVVVDSNHHDHLDKWFNSYDPRSGSRELPLYFELGHLACQTPHGLFRAYAEANGVHVEWTDPNKRYLIAGNDVSQHGHRGPNGAPRGSMRAFAKTGYKTVIQHAHTPGWFKGCIQVGTSAHGMSYARGYSSWLTAHCLLTRTKKRTLIFAINDRYSPLCEEWLKV